MYPWVGQHPPQLEADAQGGLQRRMAWMERVSLEAPGRTVFSRLPTDRVLGGKAKPMIPILNGAFQTHREPLFFFFFFF